MSAEAAARRVRLFGPPAFVGAAEELAFGEQRTHQLLVMLALRRGWVSRNELATLFWPDRSESLARSNLRLLLKRSQAVPGVQLMRQGDRVQWPVSSDLRDFDDAVAAGDDVRGLALSQRELLEGYEPGLPEELLDLLTWERQRIAERRAACERRLASRPVPSAPKISELVGRDSEVAQLVAWLRDGVRCIAIVGPGGIGKSALLQQALPAMAAAAQADAVPVALAHLADVSQVPSAILRALGRDLRATDDPWPQVATALQGRPRLLALDNAEHFTGLDERLAVLMNDCPLLRMVVATQRRLHTGQHLPLAGLELPPAATPPEQIHNFPAAQLFERQARRAVPGWSPGGDTDALLMLLQLTEGLPLAIELAASALRLQPLGVVAEETRASLALLEAGAGRGLRACFDRSWAALDDNARGALARLAWLPGPFGPAFAHQVAQVPLQSLAELADRSLLRAGDDARFSLHPLLRHFVLERSPLDRDALAAQHATFVDRLLAHHDRSGQSGAIPPTEALAGELPHLRVAWAWALLNGSPETVRRHAHVNGQLHMRLGLMHEILPMLNDAWTRMREDNSAALAAKALTRRTQAMLEFHAGRLPAAEVHAREALRAANRARDVTTAVLCLTVLGNALFFMGRQAEAGAVFEQASRRARALRLPQAEAAALNGMGLAARASGRLDEAERHYRGALELNRQLGDAHAQLGALNNLINLLYIQRRFAAALEAGEAALALATRIGAKSMLALLHVNQATSALEEGDLAVAAKHLPQAFAALPVNTTVQVQVEVWLSKARLDQLQGDSVSAAQAFQRALAEARATGSASLAVRCVVVAGRMLAWAGDNESAAAMLSWAHSQPVLDTPGRAAVDYVLNQLQLGVRPASEVALPAEVMLEQAMERLMRLLQTSLAGGSAPVTHSGVGLRGLPGSR